MKTSPIFYMGNKKKLIEKGLINTFPKDIDTFVDVFCGSGVVSMNVKANNYFLNDKNDTIIELLRLFKNNKSTDIIQEMEQTIQDFNLLKGFNKRSDKETDEYKENAQRNYNMFRHYYNTSEKTMLNLYILSYYCNNNNIRFNKSGDFNMPIGNQYFNKEKHSQKIIDGCEFLSKDNVALLSNDFRKLNIDNLGNEDFVYLDPPYSNTLAIYNEQQGWTIEDDKDLFELCDRMTEKGIKWAMSNVFENKGITNEHLIEWSNKYNVKTFDGFTYVSCGKGNSNAKEVLIMNY